MSPQPLIHNSSADDASEVWWGGVVVAIGSLGIFATSVLYALSPAPAALPIPNPSFADALAAMAAGRMTIMAAGRLGIISDIIFAAGALVLMVFRAGTGVLSQSAGHASLKHNHLYDR